MAASVTFSVFEDLLGGPLEAGGVDDVGGDQLARRRWPPPARCCAVAGTSAFLPIRASLSAHSRSCSAERAVLQRLQQVALQILLLDLAGRLERRGRGLGGARLRDEARDLRDHLVGRELLVVERGVERLGVGVRLAGHGVDVRHVGAVLVCRRRAGAGAEHDEAEHEHEYDDAHDGQDAAHVGAVAARRRDRRACHGPRPADAPPSGGRRRDRTLRRRTARFPWRTTITPQATQSRRRRPLRMSEPLQDAPILAPDLPRTPCPGAVS